MRNNNFCHGLRSSLTPKPERRASEIQNVLFKQAKKTETSNKIRKEEEKAAFARPDLRFRALFIFWRCGCTHYKDNCVLFKGFGWNLGFKD